MTGDFSRNTFDRDTPYSLVRMQQGRLFTDADWNEQAEIVRAGERAANADVIGHAGFPADDPGFALRFDAGAGVLAVGEGTGYVAGVRHRLETGAPLTIARQSGNGANIVWRIDTGGALGDGDCVTLSPKPAADLHRVTNVATAQDGTVTFRTTPALPADTTGVFRAVTTDRQPFAADDTTPAVNGSYIAFLKSTEVPVTALDDPDIREVAFDGPDTAARDLTIWQVQVLNRSLLNTRGLNDAALTCEAMSKGIDPVLGFRSPGLLRARALPGAVSDGPCALPPAAGYRSLDNRLYRVQIHMAGSGPTHYKWSSDNALHRTRYDRIDSGTLVVQSTGRDEGSGLKAQDWIEIRDTGMILSEAPGFFAQIAEVVGNRVSLLDLRDPMLLTPLLDNGVPDTDKLPTAAFVTRWEGGLPQEVDGEDWEDLENGVQVGFTSGRYQPGDYWTIPARSVTGDVDWPENADGAPAIKLPEGPRRDYAALAYLTRNNAGWVVERDCRQFFAPLQEGLTVAYAGGDGQEAMPDPLNPGTLIPLAKPLRVQVTRGHQPVQGEVIEFRSSDGNGRFGNGAFTQRVETDSAGMARVEWHLDGATQAQQVWAHRSDSAGQRTHSPIAFYASLSTADQISFDPTGIDALAGLITVQDAIEALAGMQQIGCSTHIVRPGPGWEQVLENLPAKASVSICFAPGEYTLARTVAMGRLDHVTLHGSGPGVARIVIDRTESALRFEECASVTVKGLTIETPAGNSGITDHAHRGGTLNFNLCDEVTVMQCNLSCGGGISTTRSCLTVRGPIRRRQPGPAIPSRSVTIRDNHFSVGHMQEAVLVTDAQNVSISGNQIEVRRKAASGLTIDRFLKDKAWVAKTVGSLVSQPVKGRVTAGKGDVAIAADRWQFTFRSPLPQEVWDAQVKANPPTRQQLASVEQFEKYAGELVQMTARQAPELETFKPYLERLRTSLGADSDALEKPEVLANLIVTSKPRAGRFDQLKGADRQVVLEANGNVISFDSPFSQADWTLALRISGDTRRIANTDQLVSLANGLAEKMIKDREFSRQMGSVLNWLDRFRDQSVSLAFQGIVCGGRILGNVAISDNIIRDCQVGIRVAPSHLQDRRHDAESVLIENNRMELLKQGPDFYAGYGLFVGNARTVRIEGNDMKLSPRANGKGWYAQGIRIWGFVGRLVLVNRNRIAIATMGVRLFHVDPQIAEALQPLCVLSQNVVEGPKGTVQHKATNLTVTDDTNQTHQDL